MPDPTFALIFSVGGICIISIIGLALVLNAISHYIGLSSIIADLVIRVKDYFFPEEEATLTVEQKKQVQKEFGKYKQGGKKWSRK